MTGRWEDEEILKRLSQVLKVQDGIPVWFASTLKDIKALPAVRS